LPEQTEFTKLFNELANLIKNKLLSPSQFEMYDQLFDKVNDIDDDDVSFSSEQSNWIENITNQLYTLYKQQEKYQYASKPLAKRISKRMLFEFKELPVFG